MEFSFISAVTPVARRFTGIFAITAVLLAGGLSLLPATASAAENCNAQANWFPHRQTPRPNDRAFKSSSNCAFHQWAWQMFLWLTQDWGGKPRFLSFQSPQSLLGMKFRGMLPRKVESQVPESFDEFLQAGTDGIMVDQSGHPIYYSQYIDRTFSRFITMNQLTNPAKVRAFNPNTPFPIFGRDGALELKASWKIVNPGENVSGMYTMYTRVAKLENRNGTIVVDPSKSRRVKVALVGFHIGGIVEGHPEMIWATFEHKDNAPNVPAKVSPDTVVSNRNWTFYKAGTPYKDCNINPAKTNTLKLNESRQTLSPITQVCRRYEFGNDPSSNDPSVVTNDNNIAALNAQVDGRLKGIWRNYFEVGAIWFNKTNGLKPGMNLATDDVLTGSLKLSNATIETFTQTQSTMNNCFRCHNTAQEFPPSNNMDPLPPSNLNISHAFQNIYFWSQEIGKDKTLMKIMAKKGGAGR